MFKLTRIFNCDRGQSATEVLLTIPFLMLVMLLGINFGKAFLLKQKAVVAARYAAWQDMRIGRMTSASDMQKAGYGEDQMQLISLPGGTADQGAITLISGVSSVSNFLGPSLGCLRSAKTVYDVSYRWSPLGRLLRDAELSSEHHVLGGDCRHKRGETGVLNTLVSSLGWVVRVVGF